MKTNDFFRKEIGAYQCKSVAKKILALIPQKELQNNIICVYLRNLREIKICTHPRLNSFYIQKLRNFCGRIALSG